MSKKKEKPYLKIVFWIYIFAVFVIVVVKFQGSLYGLTNKISSVRSDREAGFWNYNIVPLKSISPYLKNITYGYALKNILGNIIPFVPFGFLLPIAYIKYRKFLKVMRISFVSIFGVELFQFVTMLGAFDVDDIFLNMIACLIGYCLFRLLQMYTIQT